MTDELSVALLEYLREVGDEKQLQGAVFQADMECAWLLNDRWHTHQRLELENDLVAAYMLWAGAPPPTQFMARGGGESRAARRHGSAAGVRGKGMSSVCPHQLRWRYRSTRAIRKLRSKLISVLFGQVCAHPQ